MSANGHVGKFSGGEWTDIWPTGRAQVNALLSSGGIIYAGCENGQVYQEGWIPYGNNIGSSVRSMATSGTRMYAGASTRVYYYDSANWVDTNGPDAVARSMAFDGNVLYAGCADGPLRYYDETQGVWQTGADLDSGTVTSLAWSGTAMYAGTQSGEVFRCASPTEAQPTGLDTGGAPTLSLCWDPSASALYAGTADGHVYRYDGASWTDVRPQASGSINSLSVAAGTVFAGADGGRVLRYMGGITWQESGTTGSDAIGALAWTGTNLWTGSIGGAWRGALTVPPAVAAGPATSITTTGRDPERADIRHGRGGRRHARLPLPRRGRRCLGGLDGSRQLHDGRVRPPGDRARPRDRL